MVVCSDVSKDGKKLLLTMAPKDQTDIYLYDLQTKECKTFKLPARVFVPILTSKKLYSILKTV